VQAHRGFESHPFRQSIFADIATTQPATLIPQANDMAEPKRADVRAAVNDSRCNASVRVAGDIAKRGSIARPDHGPMEKNR
jgi:hypothetical protein